MEAYRIYGDEKFGKMGAEEHGSREDEGLFH